MANVSRSRTMKILDLVWLHLISRHQTRTYFQLFRAKLLTSVLSATGLVLHVPLGLSSRQDVRAKWERRKSYSDLWYFRNSSIALDSFGCKACWVWGRRWATGSTKRTFNTIWRWYKRKLLSVCMVMLVQSQKVKFSSFAEEEEKSSSSTKVLRKKVLFALAREIILFHPEICNTAGVVQWKLF